MTVVVLTGGVGGAKLVLGLANVMPPEEIVAIVNTGDDFEHLGLSISPDIDTLLYTLSGKANTVQGWGRAGESWGFMAALRELGGEDWFQLGDGDLALHVLRSMRLRAGDSLSVVTRAFAQAWSIGVTVLPMSDDPVRTRLDTAIGPLDFQQYFVRERCVPAVNAIRFDGADGASPAPGVIEAIAGADAILIAPSNPFLSIDPILAVPAIRAALLRASGPVVAVSPIVGGAAVKGPTAKLMTELGLAIDNHAIARHYRAVIDGLVVHAGDPAPADGLLILETDTMMTTLEDRIRVARATLALAESAGRRRSAV
ncbi:2-phospho-L-lactate transferase [Sphingomonas immobilis]|uniref:2-phospho-L-lactate transferase n=1 Tax=Sphingomonas immobilis TaxID=3063997 RepID=A0ABT9A012_9SPHN|nr:2-phospho-L-lactate transferase [Sphingomonas sp. CA1-15]MDO7843159.1 2-phospho-L-lactate transferase [Sphingomonas sp. CA1-15]